MYKRLLMSFACCFCLGQIMPATAMAEITSPQAKAIAVDLYKSYLKTSEGKRASKTPDFSDRGFYFSATQQILNKIQDALHRGASRERALREIGHQLEALALITAEDTTLSHSEFQQNLRITLTGLKFLADYAGGFPEGLKRIKSLMGDYYQMKQEILWPDLVSMVYPDGSIVTGALADQEFIAYVQENVNPSNGIEDEQALNIIQKRKNILITRQQKQGNWKEQQQQQIDHEDRRQKQLDDRVKTLQKQTPIREARLQNWRGKQQRRKGFSEALEAEQRAMPNAKDILEALSEEKDAENETKIGLTNQELDKQDGLILKRMKHRLQKKHPEEKLSPTLNWAEKSLGKHRDATEERAPIEEDVGYEEKQTVNDRLRLADKERIRQEQARRVREHNPTLDSIQDEISRAPFNEEKKDLIGDFEETIAIQNRKVAGELEGQQNSIEVRRKNRELRKKEIPLGKKIQETQGSIKDMGKQKRFLIEENIKDKKNLAAIDREISRIKSDKKGAKGELLGLQQEREEAFQKKTAIEEQLRVLQQKKQALTARDGEIQQTLNQHREAFDNSRSEHGSSFGVTQEFEEAQQQQHDIQNQAGEVNAHLAEARQEVEKLTKELTQVHEMVEREFKSYKQYHEQPDHYDAGTEHYKTLEGTFKDEVQR